MTQARKNLISLDATPYYHCTSRCVRRAFLCGEDHNTGVNYEHRRQWIEDRLLTLGQVFAINICAYAIMSNHYHVVLHIDQAQAEQWTIKDVIGRWHSLYTGTYLSRRYYQGEVLDKSEMEALEVLVREWRERLMSISWFMRGINEHIARSSNEEDKCTGRFWEGRYKSQALLDEQALAACMAYVDLNPIRAKMAETPEASAHTSIQRRIKTLSNMPHQQPCTLFPFVGNPRDPMPKGLPFHLKDYIELVEWTGRIIRDDKRGAISQSNPPIIDRLDIAPKHWIYLAKKFESRFTSLVGTAYSIKSACATLNRQRVSSAFICST